MRWLKDTRSKLFVELFVVGVWSILGTTSCMHRDATLEQRSVLATPNPTIAGITSSPDPNSILMPARWQSKWLQGVPCRPPCWEGITPGVTTADDGLTMLKTNPLLTNVKRISIPNESDGIVWNWLDGSGKSNWLNLDSSSPSHTVSIIAPNYPQLARLGDVLDVYGDPTYVIASGEHFEGRTFYGIKIIYLSKGFLLSISGAQKPSLDKELMLGGLVFFSPTLEGLSKYIPSVNTRPEQLTNWIGLKSFEFYCRDDVGGRICQANQ